MKYNVTDIEFYLDEIGDGDPSLQLTFDEEIAIRDNALGVWEADDENDLLDEITTACGYEISTVNYDIQLK
tara:strand:+ start:245 stop:457 length:213 start_codon:yes stop_codon:yes gene_type:complete